MPFTTYWNLTVRNREKNGLKKIVAFGTRDVEAGV
jgi:hypothetical protein